MGRGTLLHRGKMFPSRVRVGETLREGRAGGAARGRGGDLTVIIYIVEIRCGSQHTARPRALNMHDFRTSEPRRASPCSSPCTPLAQGLADAHARRGDFSPV